MSRLILLLPFFISMRVSGQTTDTAHFLLRTGSCRPTSFMDVHSPDTIRIFIQPENRLVTTLLSRLQRKFPFEVTLPRADYRIVFRNTYGQTVKKDLHLYDDTLTEYALCPDSLISYPENTLAKLKDKESLTITYQATSCFGQKTEKINITRLNGRLTVRYYGDSIEYYLKGDSVHSRYRNNILLHRKIFTPEDSLAFIGFENELRMARNAKCTTQEYYTVKSKYWNAQIQDGTCMWGGYFRLKIAWFGPPSPEYAEFLSRNWPGFNKFAHGHYPTLSDLSPASVPADRHP